MRKALRWFVVLVLAVDAAVAILVLGGAMLETSATTTAGATVPAETAQPPAAPPKTVALPTAAQPAANPAAPAASPGPGDPPAGPSANGLPMSSPTESEAAGAIPGAAATSAAAPDSALPEAPASPSAATAARASLRNDAFLRLQRAYESMEPESAAKALIALAGRDQEAVIELLMGWKPRTSGAILDAVTQSSPSLAADLSYEIWKRSGGTAGTPARTGR